MSRSVEAEKSRVLAAARDCRFVELQFTDVTGTLKNVVIPAHQLEETLAFGHWFDGSALEGSARAIETDLMLRPDLRTWAVVPWSDVAASRTGRLLCAVYTPDEVPYSADPRSVLTRMLDTATQMGMAYQVAAEVEFFLFRRTPAGTGGAAGAIGMAASRGGYFDHTSELDAQIRNEVAQTLGALGVGVAAGHHEIAPGQHEIDVPLLPALAAADAITTCKYAVKSIARRHGMVATFMPKPLAETAGSGLHLVQVLRAADGSNAFAEPLDEHGLSSVGRSFVAGQLAHARAMCAVLAPSVNSYKRLGRGFDAPSSITWSQTHPFSAIRVPRLVGRRTRATSNANPVSDMYVELRCPDPSCNPYLALAVSLAAGLDGIRTGAELPSPSEATVGTILDESQVEVLPGSLAEALQELAWDSVVRDALGAAVFERLLYAREQEWETYRRQVSAWEVERYFESA